MGIPYERAAQHTGRSKYTLRGLVQLAIDGLFSFSTTPLRLATYAGFGVSAVAFLGALFTLAQGLFPDAFATYGLRPVPGFVTTVISTLFIGGVQLICVGIIGEYVGRIYDEVKGRPPWVIRETIGWPGTSDDAPTPDPSVPGPTCAANP